MASWSAQDIPSQIGRTAVITGTGGLGYQCALGLVRAGGDVIIAGRNAQKGAAAVDAIRAAVPGVNPKFALLDLADQKSIAVFSARIRAERQHIDLLINNAAVMAPPRRATTADGFELQLGTNFLGHFALTARLLPLLRNGGSPRVVTVSALAARSGSIDFEDVQAERGYRPWAAYCRSKLADLLFSLELQRRSDAAGWGLMSVAAHPGIAHTELVPNGMGKHSAAAVLMKALGPLLFQTPERGALPILFAATSPLAKRGSYYGPNGRGEVRGTPALAKIPPQARDLEVARSLWSLAERLVGSFV